jgi:hypothetical protein
LAFFKSALLVLTAASVTLPALQAQASGQLPPTTIEDRKLRSFAACRAFLETTWRNDLRKANPQPIPGKGGTRQTLIDTKGVVMMDRKQAEYEVEEGWQFRSPLPDTRQIRTSYSYDRRRYECRGRHLTGVSTQGYALEGYEPMQEGGGAQ